MWIGAGSYLEQTHINIDWRHVDADLHINVEYPASLDNHAAGQFEFFSAH